MQQKKVVENYEFRENDVRMEDGVEVYPAKHIVLNQMFTIKKINARQTRQRSHYQTLTNEVSILKHLHHPNIIQCHKMLSTANNYYLIYDFCDGKNLEEHLQTPNSNTLMQVVKQLISVLTLLKEKNVVHTNLSPKCIYVSSTNVIKVTKFIHAHNLGSKTMCEVKYASDEGEFQAPEIVKLKTVHINSDIYSLGCIFQEMAIWNISSFKRNHTFDRKKCQELIKSMKSQDPKERPSIDNVSNFFTTENSMNKPEPKLLSKEDGLISSRKIEDSISKTRSDQGRSEKKIQKKGSLTSLHSEKSNIYKNYALTILKRRNLSIFLVQMSETCLKGPQCPERQHLSLAFEFLKKSTILLARLEKHLNGDKEYQNQIDFTILQKDRKLFQKTNDYYKIITTISKQLKLQKKWIEEIKKTLELQISDNLKEKLRKSTCDDQELRSQVLRYLKYITNNPECKSQLDRKIISRLSLMSEIISHKTYENMFQQLISEEKISLEDQPMYLYVDRTDERNLIKEIESRMKSA